MKSTNSHFRYAQAIIRTASKMAVDEFVLEDLRQLNECFKDSDFRKAMKSLQTVKKADLEKVIGATFDGKIQKITMNMLILLARSNKLELVPSIYKLYSKYFHHAKGIEMFTVRTARKLSEDEQSVITGKLMQKRDRPASVEFEVDPKLIAGMQIMEKGFLTDYSAKSYLENLKKKLLT